VRYYWSLVTAILVALALGLGMKVQGNTHCPSVAQIDAQLRRLMPSEPAAASGHRARVTRQGRELVLELREKDGVLLARRSYAISKQSCTEQARQVAVILAAWEARLVSGDLRMPELPEPPAPPVPAAGPALVGAIASPLPPSGTNPPASATASPTVAAVVAPVAPIPPSVPPVLPPPVTVTAPAPSPPPETPPTTVAEAPAPPNAVEVPGAVPEAASEPSGWTLDLGAGALASYTGRQVALGGLALLVFGAEQGPWIGLLSLTAVGNHSLSLDSGSARWSRFGVNLGPGLRLRFGKVALEPFLMASLAWLHLTGSGFEPSTTVNSYDIGLGGGARASVSLGRLRPWLAVTLGDWLLGSKVTVEGGSQPPVPIPNFELILQVGLSWELL
jgi:hypothetical protein